MNALRAGLEANCRKLGHEPVEPLLVLSKNEQLLSPVALKLGLDPAGVLGDLPGRVQDGMLVLEPDYALEPGPLVGLEPRWENLFRMAEALRPPPGALATAAERQLLAYACWRKAGLGHAGRLRELLDAYYETTNVLAMQARVDLCRMALAQ